MTAQKETPYNYDTFVRSTGDENLVIPLVHGAAEFDHALARGGEKAQEDFRRAFGNTVYALQKIGSKLEPVINPANRDLE